MIRSVVAVLPRARAANAAGLPQLVSVLTCALAMLSAAVITPALPPPGAPPERLYKERRFTELRAYADERLRENPGDAGALFFLGMLALEEKRDPDLALPLLERAVQIAPSVGVYHSGLGGALGLKALRGGLSDKLRYGFRVHGELARGVELSPRSVPARMALGQFYVLAPGIAGGDLTRGRLQGIELARLDPHAGALLLGQVEEKEERFAEAEQHYRRSLALATDAPDRAAADIRLGYLLLHQRRVAEAVACFEDATRDLPLEPNSFDSLGEAQLQAGHAELAVQSYRRALAVNPLYEFSLFGLGRALESRGEPEARTWYQRYLHLVDSGDRADEARDRLKRLSAR